MSERVVPVIMMVMTVMREMIGMAVVIVVPGVPPGKIVEVVVVKSSAASRAKAAMTAAASARHGVHLSQHKAQRDGGCDGDDFSLRHLSLDALPVRPGGDQALSAFGARNTMIAAAKQSG